MLSETALQYTIFGLAIAIPLYFLLLYFLKGQHKGRITILPSKATFTEGEKVSGRFECEFKKPLTCKEINVHLVRSIEIREEKDEKTKRRTERRIEDSQKIKINRAFSAGDKVSYNFQLKNPVQRADSLAGVVVDAAFAWMLDRTEGISKWTIEVDISVEGINLRDKCAIAFS